MASNRKVMVLPGDGIGNEVMAANMRIMDWLAKHRSLDFDVSEGLVGGRGFAVDASLVEVQSQIERSEAKVKHNFLARLHRNSREIGQIRTFLHVSKSSSQVLVVAPV